MAIQPEYNKEYDNYSIKPKHLGVNDSFTFKLGFDEPRSGESKFGTWYAFAGELLEPVKQDKVSFFASPKLAESLMKHKTDDIVKITKRETPRQKGTGSFTTYEVESLDSGADGEVSEVEKLAETLVKNSGGEQKMPSWIKEQLADSGVTDDAIVLEVVQKYAQKW